MIVYHGSSEIVKNPDIIHSYHALDFGCGFYVTSNEEQAVTWAKRKAVYRGVKYGILNCYEMKEDMYGFKVKTFAPDLNEWLDFVCACREGQTIFEKFDLITGKVADDKVFRVVEKYRSGDWERGRALKEIRAYPNYDQTAFISQRSIDQLLTFREFREI